MMKLTYPLRVTLRLATVLAGLGVVTVGLGPRGCQRNVQAAPLAAISATQSVVAGGPSGPAWEIARVTRIVDGDTYDLLVAGQLVRVRLLSVDAPEHDQAFGSQATDSVTCLLHGRLVGLQRRGLDLYNRTLGAVRLLAANPAGGPSRLGPALDSLLVVRGWAWTFDPGHVVAGRAAQQTEAQRAGRGLWRCGADAPVPPKLWRGFTATIKRRYRGGCTW